MWLESAETRDCPHCSQKKCEEDILENLNEYPCLETITTVLDIKISGKSFPTMKIEKTSSINVLGYDDCVCWSQDLIKRRFRRPQNMFGFSGLPENSDTANRYRMVDTAKKPKIQSQSLQFE